jgi:ribonuclease HII
VSSAKAAFSPTSRLAALTEFDETIRCSEADATLTLNGPGFRLAGFDEAGRGALAGPVVVACVHFDALSDPGRLVGLDDSKRLTPRKREALYERICTLCKWGVGWASHSVIDRRGIVPALTLAARRAYRAMGQRANLLLLDRGLSLRSGSVPWEPLIDPPLPKELTFTKGDAQSLHIAAASILAKVSRDRMMTRIHARFPDYGFDRNKGYGTASHFAALRRLGPSSIHRRSFRLA